MFPGVRNGGGRDPLGARETVLRRLRGYEVLGVALPTAVWLWESYFTIYPPGDMGGWVHRYVQRA